GRDAGAGGRVERAEGDLVAAADGRVTVRRLPDLIIILHHEEMPADADEEGAALLAIIFATGPAAIFEAGAQRVNENRGHEAFQRSLGLGRLEGVVDQLAHADRRGEAEQVWSIVEHLGIGPDGEAPAAHAGAVASQVDPTI